MTVIDDFIDNELYLGFKDYFNTTRKDCVWRNAFKDHTSCAEEVKIWLYSNGGEELVRIRFGRRPKFLFYFSTSMQSCVPVAKKC